MIIYTGTLREFSNQVILGRIADSIEECFRMHNFNHNNNAEYRSWTNSLNVMNNVLCNNSGIDQDIRVAIEYQIPLTSKRVDFLISGKDENDKSNVIIVELKQWETCEKTTKENLVTTFVGGCNRTVTHPCYQAYSYAKTIESFNESVREKEISLLPCAFCHNFKDNSEEEIRSIRYDTAIQLAPLFLKGDALLLRDFVKKYIKRPDNGEILYTIENGKIKPSIALQDALSSLMKGNKVFTMIDEQQVAYATIKELVESYMNDNQKHTVIVEGGPGTGKSVIAINLLTYFLNKGLNTHYITKNQNPRDVFVAQLVKDDFKKSYINSLFKGSGSYIGVKKNAFDCLLVDEAHRLRLKSGLFCNLGESQIKEIINASKVSVFFIDENQVVTTQDYGSIKAIKDAAAELYSIVHCGEDLVLSSQFRCNGSDGYLAFLDNLLGIKETANIDLIGLDYDLEVFDDPNKMREKLRIKNLEKNKARMLAGYCYNWISKKDINLFDINLENGFKAQWNFSNTTTRAIDKDSFEQVGCIHTSQGLEFDYVGVIIGKDLVYDGNKVITNMDERAKTDTSLKGTKTTKNYALADIIIRNTYRTLLSRGQKGCYVYCEDKALAEYIKRFLK